jgi:virginiamycin B lyase
MDGLLQGGFSMNLVNRRDALAGIALSALGCVGPNALRAQAAARMQSWPLGTPAPTGIHDLAPAPDGGVWFTAQRSGHLGWFDPNRGRTELIPLGRGSAPHGVIQGPDQAAWITDGGQGAIVRVGWPQRDVRVFALPDGTPYANLNTCAFDGDGDLWFTGQSGVIGKLALKSGKVSLQDAPRGRGPYGICATPAGEVWWCSLAGSFIARIDRRSGASSVVEPPTPRQGARRVWSDSQGRIWVSEWNTGHLSVHDPVDKSWRTWKLPGAHPRAYAVYVDERDKVWVSDFGANATVRFDPSAETFQSFASPRADANIRQILGRPGEVWLPESGTEHISVIRTPANG